MALKMNYKKELNYICLDLNIEGYPSKITKEVEYPECYIVVNDVKGDKKDVAANVNFYENSSKEKIITSKTYRIIPTMEHNFIEDTYLHLKTLPEFEDAIDC